MFRTRPARFALAFLYVWFVQLVLVLVFDLAFWMLPIVTLPYWAAALTVTNVALGVLLWTQIPRALRWRPRLHPRPSTELKNERSRIARDLHDRVGSQLATAMAQLNSNVPGDSAMLRSLEDCMLDLRLVVDSMDSDNDSLADGLARLRYRLQPAMDRRGIRMLWNICPMAESALNGVARAPQVLPIVQEALSNVLQHAHATEVEVRLELLVPEAAWRLEVRDNGTGLPAFETGEPRRGSMGIAGMRHRAAALGGELHIFRPKQGGTCIRMQFRSSAAVLNEIRPLAALDGRCQLSKQE